MGITTSRREPVWKCVATVPGKHDRCIYSVSWSKVHGLVASAGADNTIRLFEIGDAKEGTVGKLTEEQQRTLNEPGVLFEAASVTEVKNAHGASDINSVAWYPNQEHGDWLASGGDDGSVRIWSLVRD